MNANLRRVLRATTILCSCALLSAPVMAAEPAATTAAAPAKAPSELDAKGQALKQEMAAFIEYEKNTQKIVGDRLETKGEIQVEKINSYYAVTLPDMTLHNQGGGKTQIGIIKINAVPGATDNLWKMSVAFPTDFYSFDATGKPTVKTSIGQQKFTGLWDSTLDHLISMDGQYSNISIVDPATGVGANIGSITPTMDMTQQPDGTWSGPLKIVAAQIKSQGDNQLFTASIGSILVESSIVGYTANDAANLKETISTTGEAAGNAQEKGLTTTPDAGLLLAMTKSMGDGGSSSFSIKDIEFKQVKDPKDPAPAASFKLGNLSFNTEMNGLKGETPSVSFSTQYSGLEMSPAGDGLGSIVPTLFDLNVAISGLPSVEKVAAAGQEGLAQTMTTSPAVLSLNSFKFNNSNYGADFSGSIQNKDGTGKAVGSFNGNITGLTALVSKISDLAKTLPQDKQGQAMMAVGMLGMVDSMGVAKDPANPSVKNYDIQLSEAGVTVNGQPVGGPPAADKTAASGALEGATPPAQ